MRAYRILEWGRPPELVDVPAPTPAAGQVVVAVAGCGLCHSDLTIMSMPAEVGEAIGWTVPFTLGHEAAGHVAKVGAGMTGLREGDPVALVSPSSCGRCRLCVRGLESSCPHGLAGRGYGRDGALAEYVLVDDVRGLVGLSALSPRTAGPLTDAGATAYHAVRRALPRIHPGGTAVVIGAGGLGSFAIQFLRVLTAARVVAVDTDPGRHGLARELGAHTVLTSLGPATDADAVLDFVGADATIAAGCAAVRTGGAYGLIGAGGGKLDRPWYGGLPRDGEVFTFQGSSISDVQDVIALAEAGLIRNEVDEFAFDRVGEAYEALRAGRLRGRANVVIGG